MKTSRARSSLLSLVAIDPAAQRRSRRLLASIPGPAVADPTRGTRVAIAFPLLAAALAGIWLGTAGTEDLHGSAAKLTALAVLAALAERITFQLGPRSWYTPTTPVIVLAALVGGPVGGVLVAVAPQAVARDSVWRRRAAGAGLGALQGIAAGLVGRHDASTTAWALVLAFTAMTAAVAVNSAGRWLIMIERRTSPLREIWVRGALIDLVEAAIAVPILASLLLVAPQSEVLAVAVLGALLAALAIAERTRETTIAALETEQANARRDILTGAPNRRAFQELLSQQHARVVRGESPAALFMVDVDRFKAINDRHGHHAGDLVLVEIVRRLQEGLRATDSVSRWGGEELTVLAPGIRSRRGLEQFAERIRALIGDVPLSIEREAVPVTVSVGGTLLDGSLSPGAAIARADASMYEAKRTRDAWVVSLPPRLDLRLDTAS